jgi:glyoxylase-like metal-dependent hydrolase (beta-lactamase superfamily II)
VTVERGAGAGPAAAISRAGRLAVRRLSLPVPFPLRTVNVYLVGGPAGTLLVDTGYYARETWTVLTRAIAAFARRAGALRAIAVTHHHPDHIGMAGRLQQRFGVPVVMAAGEAALLPRVWAVSGQQEELAFYRAHGAPSATLAAIRAEYRGILADVLPLPDCSPAAAGPLLLAGLTFRPVVTPGHSPAHLCLFHAASQTLFVGDQVLAVITPNIGWYPYVGPDPLRDFFDSFGSIEALPVRRALPGHRDVIRNVKTRIAELRAHHADRLAAVQAILDRGAATGYEVACGLFGALSPQQMRLGLVEALAHLEHLRRRGLVAAERRARGVVYRRVH